MSFDAITYAAANAAKLPLGTFIEAFPGDVPTGDWVHLDGTLISKAAYPKAADILGETILFNATPTETSVSLTLPSGVSSLLGGAHLELAGALFYAPGYSTSTAISTYRLWRSTDEGVTWNAVNLTLPSAGSSHSTSLEWFGAGRVLLTITASPNVYVAYSTDSGQTWSPVKLVGEGYLKSLSCDSVMPVDGTGYFYLCVINSGNTAGLYAFNPANNTVYGPLSMGTYNASYDLSILGGRRLTGESSEVHYSSSNTWNKSTFNGTTFSSATTSTLTGFPPLATSSFLRTALTSSASGDYVVLTPLSPSGTRSVHRLPTNWNGQVSNELSFAASYISLSSELLTNTLFALTSNSHFDLTTVRASVLPRQSTTFPNVKDRFGHVAYSSGLIGLNSGTKTLERIISSTVITSIGAVATVRTRRTINNFFGGVSASDNIKQYLQSSELSAISPLIAATGQLRTIKMVSNALSVKTYSQANDYSQYLHLPYLPGLCCKLR